MTVLRYLPAILLTALGCSSRSPAEAHPPEAGSVAAGPTAEALPPAGVRSYVRLGGLPQHVTSDRTEKSWALLPIAWKVLRSARPELRSCLAQAYVRDAPEYLTVAVDMTLLPDGQVRDVAMAGGSFVDAEGSRCVVESIARASGPADDDGVAATRVRVPLLFFYEGLPSEPSTSFAWRRGDSPSPPPCRFCVGVYRDNVHANGPSCRGGEDGWLY